VATVLNERKEIVAACYGSKGTSGIAILDKEGSLK